MKKSRHSRKEQPSKRNKGLPAAALLAASLVCACSTISTKQTPPPQPVAVVPFPFPPTENAVGLSQDDQRIDQDLEKRLKENSNDSMRLFVRYRQAQLWAKLDPARSCKHWSEAANEARFPLREVAQLRAMEVCPADQAGFNSIDTAAAQNQTPWLKEALIRAALARAQKTNDKPREMQLLVDVVRYDRLQSEKVKKLEKALTLARELKDTTFEASITSSLKAIAPRFNTEPTAQQYISVAGDFRQTRQFEKAREWYKKAVAAPELDDVVKLQALDGIRMSYKLEKDVPNFLSATQAYSDFARQRFFDKAKGRPNAEKRSLLSRYLETQITLARAVWTEGSARQARELMEKAERDIKSRVSTASSSLLRARIEEEAGRFDGAVKILEAVPEKRVQDRGQLTKMLWYRAWNLRKMGRHQDAIVALQRLIPLEDSTTLLARNHFWLARTYAQVGQADKAKEEYEWLIENDPLGYYGLLSYREIGRPLSALGMRVPASNEPPPLVAGPTTPAATPDTTAQLPAIDNTSTQTALSGDEILIFEWLMSVNENDLGRRYLDSLASKKRGLTDEQSFDLLQLYARTGQFHSLFAKVAELPGPAKRKLIEQRPELYFPRPWQQYVDDASVKFRVPSELIYSIMRQESSFNPSARSHADAFGLMQLIPEVARVAGKRADLMIEHHEDLYRPDMNIPLGAAFLRDLLDRWNEKFIPVVASYNASEKAIAGWLKTRFRGDVLEFIEDVPYDETKTYLKLVMRNFVFYSRLTAGTTAVQTAQAAQTGTPPAETPGAPSVDKSLKPNELAFPEWCLADLQDIKP